MKMWIITGLSLVIIIGAFLTSGSANEFEGIKMEVYKSPSCGCCTYYADYLKAKGADVEVILVEDIELNSIKQSLGIPIGMYSCHTTKIGDYFIEGHIPKEGLFKLLNEKPNIGGIALPGMPSGSPGMPGAKSGDFVIYSISEGQTKEFMRI
ncbi:MAG: hypothetical protein GOU98_01040 [Candidatus Altiarchaeota archaeon]|nr:hypothetical protein [Candidatus Altiarchaeota archaeon]